MILSSEVRALLGEAIGVGSEQQAFPLVTVDTDGFPYFSLISRAEIRVRGASTVLIAVRGANTRAHLARDGRAGMIAVGGTAAHYLKLRVVGNRDEGVLEAYALDLVGYRRDSLGIELSPISYVVTPHLVEREGWEQTEAILSALQAEMEC